MTKTTSPPVTFGEYLCSRRLEAGMSQTDLAMALRMRGPEMKWSQATVSQLENGKRTLRATEVAALASVLGVPAAELLDKAVSG